MLAHHLDGLEQLAEALQRVVLRLDRDEHLRAGDQRVQREQPERGRAVDEDVVEALLARLRGRADPRVAGERLAAAGSRAPPRSPARSRRRPGRWWRARPTGRAGPSLWVITSASGSPSTSMSYVEGTPRWCSTLSAVEALPCGSRSMTRTRCPSWASAAATLTVDVVLPTPPFWLATTNTRVSSGRGTARPRCSPPVRARTECSAARASGVRVVVEGHVVPSATSAAVRTWNGDAGVSRETRTPACGVSRETATIRSPVDELGSSCG